MNGNVYDYGFRIYNPQIAKFLSLDPLAPKYPELTPYQFASNRPIDGLDLDGCEFLNFHSAMYRIKTITMTPALPLSPKNIAQHTSNNHGRFYDLLNGLKTSWQVVEVVFGNIPKVIQNEATKDVSRRAGGEPGVDGEDEPYSGEFPNDDGFTKNYRPGPEYKGSANSATKPATPKSMKPVSSHVPIGGSYEKHSGAATGASFVKAISEIIENISNMSMWDAYAMEARNKRYLYAVTKFVNYANETFNKHGKWMRDFNKNENLNMRGMLINFMVDGYLPTSITDGFVASGFSPEVCRAAYREQLEVAVLGMTYIINNPGMAGEGNETLKLSSATLNSVTELLKKYKSLGGGNEFDERLKSFTPSN